jgi:hypothetical protein
MQSVLISIRFCPLFSSKLRQWFRVLLRSFLLYYVQQVF